jgi:hypothetical protein
VAETVSDIAGLEGYDQQLAETIVDLWASVFHVNVGEFPGLVTERFKKPDLNEQSGSAFASATATSEPFPQRNEKTDSTRESRRQDAAAQMTGAVTEPADIVVKKSFADNKKTADFLNPGSQSRAEEKKSKKPVRLEDSTIVPLQPDMMAYSQPAPADQLAAKQPGIDEAFRSLRNGEYQKASKIMMELARAGDTRAQYHLGEFYLMGTGVEQSNDKAKYWFRKASARGSLPARTKLEALEEPEGQTGCLGCAFAVFMVVVVLKFLSGVV